MPGESTGSASRISRSASVPPVDAPIATLRLSGGPAYSEPVTVVGWGLDETGSMPSTRRKRENVAVTGNGPTLLPGNMYGIGDAEVLFGEVACLGDSGGPAFSPSGALVGVASRVGNGKPRDPANGAATCVGETAHSTYTHLGRSQKLIERAFFQAGNVPVVEPEAIEGAAAEKPASNDTSLASAIDTSRAAANDPSANLSAEATVDAPEGRPLTANCTVSAERNGDEGRAAAPLALLALALWIRRRSVCQSPRRAVVSAPSPSDRV